MARRLVQRHSWFDGSSGTGFQPVHGKPDGLEARPTYQSMRDEALASAEHALFVAKLDQAAARTS